MRRAHFRTVPLLLSAALVLLLTPSRSAPTAPGGISPAPSSAQARLSAAYAHLPLAFEENRGQSDAATRFLAHGAGFSLSLTPDALLLVPAPRHAADTTATPTSVTPPATPALAPVRFAFVDANPTPPITSSAPLPGVVNYFIGNDPAQWRTNIPTAGQVRYHDLYPGIDLTVYGTQSGEWEYDVVVAPGADPAAFGVAISGGENIHLENGDVVIGTGGEAIRQRAPVLYQEVGGVRQPVTGGYTIRQDGSVGFAVGEYDRSLPLVIDPVTEVYGTYLGGSSDEQGYSIAVDSAGNAYVTGFTHSTDFPTVNAFQSTYAHGSDIYVTKINAAGTALVYSTYLGGKYDDQGYGIAVDTAGNAYLTGETDSPDFPTKNPIQAALANSYYDAFVTKINAAGNALVYSTYLGGNRNDWGNGIAVDSGGNAYVTGEEDSPDFPTKNPIQPGYGGTGDAFVTKINAAGTALVYSTFLGGSGVDKGRDITTDNAGNAYITGLTGSTDFPTSNPLQVSNAGGTYDVFLTKINAAGSALVYSTYLGGNDNDLGYAVAVDSGGNAYLTGFTASTNFPTKNPIQASFGGGTADVFVAKVNAAGTALIYSTYLGGDDQDEGYGIAVDSTGNAYISGNTYSGNFPTSNPIQSVNKGGGDAFVTELNAAGTALVYSTFLGGSAGEAGNGIALDGAGNAYITGTTYSTDFPTKNPIQASSGGGYGDAFVAKIGTAPLTPPTPTGLHVTGATYNSLTWSWSESDATAPLIYTVDGVHFYGLAAGTTTFTLSGIAYGSYACISIAAYNANGASSYTPYSCSYVVPLAPYNPHQTAGTTSTGTIAWANYDALSSEQVYDYAGAAWHQVGVNGTSYTLTGIPAGYYHCAAVQAYNVNYASGYSYACPFATPNAPTNIHATNVTQTSVTFAWDAPDPYSWYYVYETAPSAGHVVTGTSFTTTHIIVSGQHGYACIYVGAGGYGGTSSTFPYACAWAY